MALTLKLLIALAPAVVAYVVWWFKVEPRRRRAKLLKRIEELKNEMAEAVGQGDADRVAFLQRELKRLRREADLLA